jgi:hypothetical protein
MNIAQRWNRQVKLFVVGTNPSGRFAAQNQPKIGFAVEFSMQVLNCGCVAIRNGAIGSNKQQHDDSSIGRLERIKSFAVQILRKSALHRLRNA